MSIILAAGAARMKLEAENYEVRISELEARIADLEAQLAERVDDAEALSRTGAVKVKALGDWRRGYCDDEVTIEQVSTGFGSIYQVRIFEGMIWLDYPVREKEAFPTVEAAKAAAQADYERRILSALEATPPAPKATEEKVEAALKAFHSVGRYASEKARMEAAIKSAFEATPPAPVVTEALKAALTTMYRYQRAGCGDDVFYDDLSQSIRKVEAALTAAQEAGR